MVTPLDQRPRSGPYSGLNINSAKRFLTEQFRQAGLPTPDLDARLLVGHAAGLDAAQMIAQGTECLDLDTFNIVSNYAERRLAREPVDHILGYRSFYGRRFKLSKETLSPRPETEMLVDAALDILGGRQNARILDLGTGTGAIALSVLAENPSVSAVGVDISAAALTIARSNAETLGLSGRVSCVCVDWLSQVSGAFDIILSNPPYITDAAMTTLDPEVAEFDPALALQGGADGLTAYRAIISKMRPFIRAGGTALFEIGHDQCQPVVKLLNAHGFKGAEAFQDLAGHDRMIKVSKPS